MKIAIGSDHAGFRYKEKIINILIEKGHEVKDFGTYTSMPCDYPDFIRPVALAVAKKEYTRGIILGGSGNGEAIVANRIPGIRCTLCWNEDSTEFARKHNDSNMLSIGERLVDEGLLERMLTLWLETPFDGGRHANRLAKIDHSH
ncbi:MAG: ribose 5-phosphate isomerase B [Bacteriovoracaceae bacterium]|nr:ribose 5-phosphate isomerase B [Bacteriovoracaceae bacterium]